MRWAFERYATGDWTVVDLFFALREKGLTTRPGPSTPVREVSVNTLHKVLRNPYYLGVVTYQGVTYQGKHEALIDTEIWLRVQDMLVAHAHAGEKDRIHQHYLRGTIFCGQCGARLVFSRNKGNGGAYDYFVCTKKRTRSANCPRPAIRLEKIEHGIAAFYGRFQLTPAAVAAAQLGVRADMAAEIADAHQGAERAQRRLAGLQDERARLMQAHYADAVPLDLLKTEMARLTRAMADAERQITTATADLVSSQQTLEDALTVAGSCHRHYETAPDFVKRQINQGFFRKLIIHIDGTIERAELTEPFAQLLTPDWQKAARDTENVPDTPGHLPAPRTPSGAPPAPRGALGRPGSAPAGVTAGGTTKNPDDDLVGGGSHKGPLVGLLGALSHPCYQVQRLLDLGKDWSSSPELTQTSPPRPRPTRTARQLAAPDLDHLVSAYRDGATVYELARRFGIHRTTVGKHLRARGVDTTPPGLAPDDASAAAELYRQGCSLARIAGKYGIAADTVRTRLLEAGVRMRKPWEGGSH